jgi:hypothetical protein
LRLGHPVTIPHAGKKGTVVMTALATISSIIITMTTSI